MDQSRAIISSISDVTPKIVGRGVSGIYKVISSGNQDLRYFANV